jgi:hypothetical protein
VVEKRGKGQGGEKWRGEGRGRGGGSRRGREAVDEVRKREREG